MESIILALIVTQIIAESLPISSSGHVALISIFSQKFWGIPASLPDFLDNLLHGTALLAILVVFFNDWFYLVKKLGQTCIQFLFKSKPLSFTQKKLCSIFLKIAGLVIVADLMTSIFYFVIKIKYKSFFGNTGPEFLLFGFVITMLLLLSLKFRDKLVKTPSCSVTTGIIEAFNFKKALILGMVQGLALLPGISRFASTYVAGCWLNLRPARAFQISFLIQLPLIVAAFLFLGIKDIGSNAEILKSIDISSILILLITTACAMIALKLCYKLSIKNNLWWFGIYMLLPIMLLIKKVLFIHFF